MIRRPPRSTLFPTRRSSDLGAAPVLVRGAGLAALAFQLRRGKSPGKGLDRKSTRLNSSHSQISYAVFCLKKKINLEKPQEDTLIYVFGSEPMLQKLEKVVSK